VLSGIISGLVAGALYNRFKDVKLPLSSMSWPRPLMPWCSGGQITPNSRPRPTALIPVAIGTNSFTDPETGRVVTGDLARYFAGDPKGGQFMAGMCPVMMFGLPAACLAMYR
ncbi:PTS N-acetyl-D-glucosamine transporter, partial [Pseudomonas aeruginosa]